MCRVNARFLYHSPAGIAEVPSYVRSSTTGYDYPQRVKLLSPCGDAFTEPALQYMALVQVMEVETRKWVTRALLEKLCTLLSELQPSVQHKAEHKGRKGRYIAS